MRDMAHSLTQQMVQVTQSCETMQWYKYNRVEPDRMIAFDATNRQELCHDVAAERSQVLQQSHQEVLRQKSSENWR